MSERDRVEFASLLTEFGFGALVGQARPANGLASARTHAAAQLGVSMLDDRLRDAIRDANARDRTPVPDRFVVRGYVRRADGAVVRGAEVIAFDQDLRRREALGTVSTDERGHYEIVYSRASFARREKRRADLVVRVTDSGGAPVESLVRYDAEPVEVVHLALGAFVRFTEWELVSRAVVPLLAPDPDERRDSGAVPPQSLTDADLPFLMKETDWGEAELRAWIAANRLGADLAVDARLVYGELREGAATSNAAFVARGPSARREALGRALAAERIGHLDDAGLAAYLQRLTAIAAGRVLDEQRPNPMAAVWRRALPSQEAQQAFAALVADPDLSAAERGRAIDESPLLRAHGDHLRRLSRLVDVTGVHAPLIRALTDDTRWADARDPWTRLVTLPREELRRLLATPAAHGEEVIGVPAAVPGDDPAARTALYLDALEHALDEAAPTARLAARLFQRAIDPVAREVAEFLQANLGFDLRSGLRERGHPLSDGATARLAAIARIAKLTTNLTEVMTLLDDSVVSVGALATTPPITVGTNTSLARKTQAKLKARAEHVATWLAFAKTAGAVKPTNQAPPKTVTLAGLFGEHGYCACTECQAVDGPAAYLVELLSLLDKTKDAGDTGTALQVLRSLRPDIELLPLTCHHTLTSLPTIDLINELLEAEALKTPVVVPDTEWSADRLRTEPQQVRLDAYAVLATKTYPWQLPFEYGTELARAALAELGASRTTLLALVRPRTDAAGSLEDHALAEACEYFQIPDAERDLYTGTPTHDQVFGTGSGDLSFVGAFLQRTAATLPELQAAVSAAFDGRLALTFGESCELDQARIEPRAVADLAAALVELGSFMRLARRTGLASGDLQAALELAAPTGASRVIVPWRLAALRDRLDLTIATLVSASKGDQHGVAALDAALRLPASEAHVLRSLGGGIASLDDLERFVTQAAALRGARLAPTEAAWALGLDGDRSPGMSSQAISAHLHALVAEWATIEQQFPDFVTEQQARFDDAIKQTLARAARLDRALVDRFMGPSGAAAALSEVVSESLKLLPADKDVEPGQAPAAFAAVRQIERFGFLVHRLALTDAEARAIAAAGDAWLLRDDLADRVDRIGAPAAFGRLLAVIECARVRRTLRGEVELVPYVVGAAPLELSALAVAFGWTTADGKQPSHAVNAVQKRLWGTAAVASQAVARVASVDATMQRLRALAGSLGGASPDPLQMAWKRVVELVASLVDHTVAQTLLDDVKARLAPADWAARGQAIHDHFRARRRDALVSALTDGAPDGAVQLYDKLLIDPLIMPCQLTSRVKAAIGAVQLFIQRLLMDPAAFPGQTFAIEPAVATWWRWMQNYRVWQANRKVFLYPENWIEPELRDDKTPPFRALESALSQREVTVASVDDAYRAYLRELNEVARLEIIAIFEETAADDTRVVHLVGRRWSQPRTHYYRTRIGAVWTPWEKLEADIEGDHVMVTVHAGRPMIIWPLIREGRASTSTDGGATWEIRFCWIEREHGRWGAKRSGDPTQFLRFSDSNETRPRFFCRALAGGAGGRSPVVLVVHAPYGLGEVHAFAPSACGSPSSLAPAFQWDQAFAPLLFAQSNHPLDDNILDDDSTAYSKLMTLPGRLEVGWSGEGATPILTQSDPHDLLRLVLDLRPTDDDPSGVYFAQRPFVLQNARDTFIVEPTSAPPPRLRDLTVGSAVPMTRLGEMLAAVWNLSATGSGAPPPPAPPPQDASVTVAPKQRYFRASTLEHPVACALLTRSETESLRSLLSLETQNGAGSPVKLPTFETRYDTTSHLRSPYPVDGVDFSRDGAYSQYNWELFFHAPFLIAVRLMQNEQFEEALGYLRLVFDPTAPGPGVERAWRFKPFRDAEVPDAIDALVAAMSPDAATPLDGRAIAQQIDAYRNDPFNPHLIARLRIGAYMRAVVMRYLDCLIGWGDKLFARLTLEALNQATLLYVTAAKVLGPRPLAMARKEKAPVSAEDILPTYAQDEESGNTPPSDPAGPSTQPAWAVFDSKHFCVPPNPRLLAYWDTVDDRLWKIRHCQNLAGENVQIPLFEPPIDPALLVRAAAAGVDITRILSDAEAPQLPAYRFTVISQKALELCNDVKALGSELLSILEKRDAEALARLRTSQEIAVLDAGRAIKQGQVQEAKQALGALERQRDTVEARRRHYQEELQRMNEGERTAESHTKRAIDIGRGRQALEISAAVCNALPTFIFGTSGANVSWGMPNLGAGFEAAARIIGAVAQEHQSTAAQSLTAAAYDRRSEEWAFHGGQATLELKQLEKQLIGAEIRLAMAERELDNHDLLRDNARAVDAQMRTRFTNLELFDWMAREASSAYYHAFRQALTMARRAEACFRHERSEGESRTFIGSAQWDDLRQGLLAGTRLHRELRIMEEAYLTENKRDLEITKHISLNQLDAHALMTLRATGACEFTLPEWLFDLDFPTHYRRRIKSVAVTIPAIVGPYASVNATLSLTKATWRKKAKPSAFAGYAEADADLVTPPLAPPPSIVTSSGQNDSGMFETILRDERYLPFEGAGVDSAWKLELPHATNLLDRDAITDVVLHLRYTATAATAATAAKAEEVLEKALDKANATPPTRLFSIRHDFATAWAAFAAAPAGAASYTLELDFSRFIPPSRTTTARGLMSLELWFVDVQHPFRCSIGTHPTSATETIMPKKLSDPPGKYEVGQYIQFTEAISVHGGQVVLALSPASGPAFSDAQLAAIRAGHAFAVATFGE